MSEGRLRATPFTIVVPAREEAAVLRRTARALRQALDGLDAQVIYVLNGREDGSRDVIRSVFGEAATVVMASRAGKANALNLGDAAASRHPRFYLDADVAVERGAFEAMLGLLASGEVDLVAPRLICDLQQAGPLARRIGEAWLSLPYARAARFQGLIGLSRRGREAWGAWPDLVADDRFAALMTPPERRRICGEARAGMPLPRSIGAWIRVRARWLRGQRELARLGLAAAEPGHAAALAELLARGRLGPASLYLLVRAAAMLLCIHDERTGADWRRDGTTRHD